jgi:geranylgeranyl pyrophosphate synthase
MLKAYLNSMKPIIEKQLEEFIPKQFTYGWLEANLGELRYGYNKESFSKMSEPIWDLLTRGGKRWRAVFMLLCCDVLGGGSKVIDFIPLIELIHNGTLMIDDIEDNSNERRGKPCTHKIFGIDVAINTGNMIYYLPYLLIKKADLNYRTKLRIHEIIAEEMLKLHFGQGLDIYWHNNGNGITEDLYLQMCAFKTGCLARLAARIGALLGNANKKQIDTLSDFAESIGVAFQIQDDILNITNKEWGKELGDDITEGKRTLMVIRVLEIGSIKDKQRLLSILNLKTRDENLIREAINIIKKYKAIDYARNKAKQIVTESWNKLDPLIENSESKNKLRLFADFLINREI